MGELDGNTINVKGWNGDIAITGSDKDLVPVFYAGTRYNPFKSQSAGTPVFDPVDMLKVYHPGEPLNVPERPVNELDKRRFKPQWDAYKEGRSQKIEGTPLSVLFPHQLEVVKTLEAMHINTVQQLANITDTGTQNMMFGFNLRDKAKQYLETAEKGVAFHQMQKELAERDVQIKELLDAVATLKAQAAAASPPASAPTQTVDMASIAAFVQATVAAATKPKRLGWPKGKPRKPKSEPATAPQETQEN